MRFESRVRGFTLLELVVTVAILAIVLAAAVPSFMDFLDRYRLRGAVDDVMSAIANARAGAVKSDRDVRVVFGGTTAAWCVGANAAAEPAAGAQAGVPAACDCTDNTPPCVVGGEAVIVPVGRHGAVSTNTVAVDFTFDSKFGVVMPLGGQSVTFTSPAGKYDLRLDLNTLGQASVCVPDGKPVVPGVAAC